MCVHRYGYCTETTKKNIICTSLNITLIHGCFEVLSITLETLNVAEMKDLRIYNIYPVSQLYRYRLADINQCVPAAISCRYPYTIHSGCSKKVTCILWAAWLAIRGTTMYVVLLHRYYYRLNVAEVKESRIYNI